MPEPDSRRKGSKWLSLLSVLMAARVQSDQVVLVERADSGGWEFAFWNRDPDGIPCTYRCAVDRAVWAPIESPAYTGGIRPSGKTNARDRDPRSK